VFAKHWANRDLSMSIKDRVIFCATINDDDYYCNNNRIYYDRSDIDKNVPNQLDQQDKYLSNFSYPYELEFGVDFTRAKNRELGVDHFDSGIVYKLYLNTFVKE
jgi:hypothetical protein